MVELPLGVAREERVRQGQGWTLAPGPASNGGRFSLVSFPNSLRALRGATKGPDWKKSCLRYPNAFLPLLNTRPLRKSRTAHFGAGKAVTAALCV